MGEKGNLLDMGEEYKQARIRGAQAPVAVGEAGAPDLAAERPSYPATG